METREQIDRMFNPRSVAVIGVPRGMKTGKLFLLALLDMGFPGPIYPVHPEATEIEGLRAYPSVSAVPGPVDLAIILVRHGQVPTVIAECADKGVKGVVLFTSGFRELGTAEGRETEAAIVAAARAKGMRIVGPNCMGLYSTRSRISIFPGLSKVPGPLGVISQSGSLTNLLGMVARDYGLTFSKMASIGNESDLTAADFLDYLAHDPDTGVIGAYLEDVKQGPYFASVLAKAARRRPVVVWKLGLTAEGGRAAASHTGSMATREEIWNGVLRQTGAIGVRGWEPWLDTMMAATLFPPRLGPRVAVLSGPGGLAVAAAEACGFAGLRMAGISDETKRRLAEFVPPTGTSLRNPIDVGLTASLQMSIYLNAGRVLAADEGVDAVFVIGAGLDPETDRQYVEGMLDNAREAGKPFIMIGLPGFDPALARLFCDNGVPFFQTAERAMTAYARMLAYRSRRGWAAAIPGPRRPGVSPSGPHS